jgi:hypothetical protein
VSYRSRRNSPSNNAIIKPSSASLLPALTSFFNVPIPIIQETLPQNNKLTNNCLLNRFEYQLSSTQGLSSDANVYTKPIASVSEVVDVNNGMKDAY